MSYDFHGTGKMIILILAEVPQEGIRRAINLVMYLRFETFYFFNIGTRCLESNNNTFRIITKNVIAFHMCKPHIFLWFWMICCSEKSHFFDNILWMILLWAIYQPISLEKKKKNLVVSVSERSYPLLDVAFNKKHFFLRIFNCRRAKATVW